MHIEIFLPDLKFHTVVMVAAGRLFREKKIDAALEKRKTAVVELKNIAAGILNSG